MTYQHGIMTENCASFRKASEGANREMVGVNFIDLKEIMDVSEEQAINEREELRRKLCEAESRLREKRELYDRLYEHGLDMEELMNEMAAENRYLASRVKEYQQQVEDDKIRKMREEEDEEALHQQLLSEEERRSKLIHIRQMHELEQVQEVLRSKDEEIEKISITLAKINNKAEEYFDTIEDLRQEQRELQEQLRGSQEEQIIAFQFETRDLRNIMEDSTAEEEDDEEHKDKSYWWCLKSLLKGVKAAGHMALCVLLPVGIMASMVPVCNSPDLWNIAFNLLEPYCELHHTVPPVI